MIKSHQQFELLGKKIIERAVVEPPFRMLAEMPDEACFYYIVRGLAKAATPAGPLLQRATEGVVLRCGNYLNEMLSSEGSEHFEAIAIHFYPEVLRLVFDNDFPDFMSSVNAIAPQQFEKVGSTSLVKAYIDSLQFYFDNPALVSEELIKIKVKEIILLLAKTDNAGIVRSLVGSMFSRPKVDAQAVVENNILGNLSIQELAALSGLSTSSFKRQFAKQQSISPAKFIKQRKLEHAAKLLLNTDLRVSEVAYDCGFSDPANFTRSFTKQYRTSPSEFRANGSDRSLG